MDDSALISQCKLAPVRDDYRTIATRARIASVGHHMECCCYHSFPEKRHSKVIFLFEVISKVLIDYVYRMNRAQLFFPMFKVEEGPDASSVGGKCT